MKLWTINRVALAGVCLYALAACNKGENDLLNEVNVIPVSFKGFNGGTGQLDVKLDTFDTQIPSNNAFDFTQAVSFLNGHKEVKLSVTDAANDKVLLEKTVTQADAPLRINFLYLDGTVSDLPRVAPIETGKLKASFMFRPTVTKYSGPVDIVLVKYYVTPKVIEELGRINNVQPNTFSETVTIPSFSTAQQQYNGQLTAVQFRALIYKAGTTEYYTHGTGYVWNISTTSVPLPAASASSSKAFVFSESPQGTTMRYTKNFEL
ncbi:hypothetical protein MKQ68_15225 [Chitinophaga horti]|uniref:Uncharacterized protein n=1 Tax=Chitinophaga horti TaxID=2920382 RepID=A0ABY6IVP1_9BACT|nr:hypothetical protein [Chitinophaga horti]UYQ91443.1 hypothetical protein MKQ68_15225 [Chitinophaga horti]